jgi:hypothetical protein
MAHARLSGGARRKASQRRVWHAPPAPTTWVTPVWPPGARVAWNGRIGLFLRDGDDAGLVELLIGSRTYRVRRAEVRSV